ncbi:MAG: hypothetical protein GTO40_21230, partial [Deltaproteobacteria bacterium]|nr:hypothetical protein [Deltaproteobacteria bacterium]
QDDPLRPVGEAFYELVPDAHQTARRFGSSKALWDLSKPLRAGFSELVIDYQAARSVPDKSVPAADGRSSTEERPRILRHLPDQDLITEEK